MGKRLLITSTDLMMIQFLWPHVITLSQNGFDIDLACSNVGGRIDEVDMIELILQQYGQLIERNRTVGKAA